MEEILLADGHGEDAGDPVVVLGQDLVAAGRHLEGRDVARDLAARLAVWVRLDEDRLADCVADILDLVRHGREDRRRARRDLRHAALLAQLGRRRRARNLELAVGDEVHGVDGVLVRDVLGARRKRHLNQAGHVGDLSDCFVEVRARGAAVGEAAREGEGTGHACWGGLWLVSGVDGIGATPHLGATSLGGGKGGCRARPLACGGTLEVP
mmetsp:Transcript_23745/g.68125  ORF Transcript_23745/g.68125 Transcript_23745/m.68125 type:complete len:210 (+) Transcript_23745:395-1024(+)